MGRSLTTSHGNDAIYSPDNLCDDIIRHFRPYGKCLEPCKGDGAFIRAFEKYGITPEWCEIEEGKDFFDYTEKVDWIITNFPYSKYRDFLHRSTIIAEHVVSLSPLNHILGSKARMRDIKNNGFFLREIILIEKPSNFPSSGFQYGVMYLNKKDGPCEFRDWRDKQY